jgi:DNA-binding transcriptional LysR family regulator
MLGVEGGSNDMHDVHFNALDLNLLRILDSLLEERSATRAGERLGLSQSAVSHALNRLRYALKDELFVRSPDGLEPTPRALRIGARVRQGLLQLQVAVTDGEFAPATADRQFVIACSDYASAAIVPGLMARLRDRAPCASLRVVPSQVGVAEALQTGKVDLAIGAFGHIPDRFRSEDLFQETLVWVLSRDNPASLEPMTLETLAELPHLIIALTGEDARTVDGLVSDHGLEWRLIRDDAGAFQGALSAKGLKRRIGLTVPHVLAAPRIVARSDMAALIPRRLAVAYAERYRLRLFDPPYPSPPHAVTAVWDQGHGEQAPVAWFRRLLREAAVEVAAGNRQSLFTVYPSGISA